MFSEKRVTLRMPSAMRKGLEEKARTTKHTLSQVIRLMLAESLNDGKVKEEPQSK